jgi:predicted chitinase
MRAGGGVVENLNYTAVRMTQVWPSRFPSVAAAQPYGRLKNADVHEAAGSVRRAPHLHPVAPDLR